MADELAEEYLAKADELAKDMETHGYGIVQTYATLALAHLLLDKAKAAQIERGS